MAPRRRSSRLNRGATPNNASVMPSPTKLSSLIEREESPPDGATAHIDAIVSSPVAPPNTAIVQRTSQATTSPIKTPSASRIQPSHEEMHPSKVQHSTVKCGILESPSRLQVPQGWPTVPEPGSSSAAIVQKTPIKVRGSLPGHMSSPSFTFAFPQRDTHLSIETQKIMESVREEAAKIKAQLQAEHGKQEPKDEEASHQLYGVGGRKIAKPKGKAGRYSDVHMQAFKKMDSIAGHASTWKTKIQPNAASLKRSNSKAHLNADEPKVKVVDMSMPVIDNERLENPAPGKRAKKNHGDDVSGARTQTQSTDAGSEFASDASKAWTETGLPSAVTTPTTASLARSASVKSVKRSMIPSLSRSQSIKTIRHAVPLTPEGGNKRATPLSRFVSVKSILHRRQPKLSNDPAKVAAGTHIPLPDSSVTFDKELPSLPSLPSTPHTGFRTPAMCKRVDFAPSTKSSFDLDVASPPPSKMPGPHSQPAADHSTAEPSLYPSLASSPNITTRIPKTSKPSTPHEFTFRADQTLPVESNPFSSKPSTIRQVRPSGITTPMTAFETLPPIPHGIINKKRRRADSDDEDVENVPPASEIKEKDDGPRAKRLKSSPQKETPAAATRKTPKTGGSAIPKPARARPGGMGRLSLSRLNVLARPKNRR